MTKWKMWQLKLRESILIMLWMFIKICIFANIIYKIRLERVFFCENRLNIAISSCERSMKFKDVQVSSLFIVDSPQLIALESMLLTGHFHSLRALCSLTLQQPMPQNG